MKTEKDQTFVILLAFSFYGFLILVILDANNLLKNVYATLRHEMVICFVNHCYVLGFVWFLLASSTLLNLSP